MKKIIACFICIIAGLFVISCGSTDVKDPTKTEDEIKTETENLEVVETEPVKIQRFDDWEYKGFGKDLPEWIDAAVDLDYAVLSKAFPGMNLLVVRGYGSNTDMCESASYENAPYPEEAEFVTALWVRVNSEYEKLSKPYISIRIFNKFETSIDDFDEVEYVGD